MGVSLQTMVPCVCEEPPDKQREDWGLLLGSPASGIDKPMQGARCAAAVLEQRLHRQTGKHRQTQTDTHTPTLTW